jgi:hypothetical protein
MRKALKAAAGINFSCGRQTGPGYRGKALTGRINSQYAFLNPNVGVSLFS